MKLRPARDQRQGNDESKSGIRGLAPACPPCLRSEGLKHNAALTRRHPAWLVVFISPSLWVPREHCQAVPAGCFSWVGLLVQPALTPWHISDERHAQFRGERTSESSCLLLVLPPAPAAHLWSTSRTQGLSRCVRSDWNSTALNHFAALFEQGYYSFLKPVSGRWGQHTITTSSPSERTAVLQNTVLLHGDTWLLHGKCPRSQEWNASCKGASRPSQNYLNYMAMRVFPSHRNPVYAVCKLICGCTSTPGSWSSERWRWLEVHCVFCPASAHR